MKVLLFRSLMGSNNMPEQPFMPPLAIYSLASVLKEKGFDVKIIDPYYYGYQIIDPQNLKEILLDADLFCLSTTTFQWCTSIKIINTLRQVRPDIPVIIGGIHVHYFGEQIIERYPVDFAIKGEGEEVLPELLETLASGRSPREVKGILMKDEKGNVICTDKRPIVSVEKLEQTPVPDFSQLPDKFYHVLPFETSRGCMNNCGFCSIVHRGRWRGLSSSVVLDKLGVVLERYQAKFLTPIIYFVDDCFTMDTDRAIDILTGICDRRLKCSLMLEARVDQLLKNDIIECISNCSISEIQIGVECGYDEGLKKIRKGIVFDQLITCVERLKRFNLTRKALLSFIIGLPWETLKEVCDTLHAAADLVKSYGVMINTAWWIPMPSRLWNERSKYGIHLDDAIYDNTSSLFVIVPQLRPLMSENDIQIANRIIKTYWDIGCPLQGLPI